MLVLRALDTSRNPNIMKCMVLGFEDNEIGFLLNQSEAGKSIKPLKVLFKNMSKIQIQIHVRRKIAKNGNRVATTISSDGQVIVNGAAYSGVNGHLAGQAGVYRRQQDTDTNILPVSLTVYIRPMDCVIPVLPAKFVMFFADAFEVSFNLKTSTVVEGPP